MQRNIPLVKMSGGIMWVFDDTLPQHAATHCNTLQRTVFDDTLPHAASNAASCAQSQEGYGIIGMLEGPLDRAIALANAARSAEGCSKFEVQLIECVTCAGLWMEWRYASSTGNSACSPFLTIRTCVCGMSTPIFSVTVCCSSVTVCCTAMHCNKIYHPVSLTQ